MRLQKVQLTGEIAQENQLFYCDVIGCILHNAFVLNSFQHHPGPLVSFNIIIPKAALEEIDRLIPIYKITLLRLTWMIIFYLLWQCKAELIFVCFLFFSDIDLNRQYQITENTQITVWKQSSNIISPENIKFYTKLRCVLYKINNLLRKKNV